MVIDAYKDAMTKCIQLYYPISKEELAPVVDYSIDKRLRDTKVYVNDTYKNTNKSISLLKLADYIAEREPIVTAHGTMFRRHGTTPNPLALVVQEFLDKRQQDKDMMYTFPKGSEDFEKYNLLQQLDKIDVNGLYGTLGMYTSLIFNINVSSSITTQGRALISTAGMFFESFLSNNVKFGSLNQVMMFIKNVTEEKRQYRDDLLLDKPITIANCFVKILASCGYRWFPDDEEKEIIWQTIQNLSQEDINRVYYKNNLYEFLSNTSMKKAIVLIMKTLKAPFFNPLKCPKEIEPQLQEFAKILKEYVYYDKMIMDRIDRYESIMKSTVMISDTDSCIISLDAWYRFALELVRNEDLQIKKTDPQSVLKFYDKDEFGDYVDREALSPIHFIEPEEDYDFYDDEIVEQAHLANPFIILPQDWLRYSIINIMSFVLDFMVNDYLEKFTKNNHSFEEGRRCKILLKNEFLFKRVLMTLVKKNYATLQEVQEGNLVPKDKQIDVKGIAAIAKSSAPDSTREALQKILLEDILEADTISQFKVIKHLAILEKKIIHSIESGSKEFYKPVTIKSMNSYNDPMRIQGVKASVVWNSMKETNLEAINLEERNAITIAKCNITKDSLETIREDFPFVYENGMKLLDDKTFKGKIDSIAIPLDVDVPEWLVRLIDYKVIVNDNIAGFPIESVGLPRLGNQNVNYTNILQL